jgi:SAM-dependent methyltransferase
MAHYRGIDVDPARIEWCLYHITAQHPGFQFKRVDVQNARYNPQGQLANEKLLLPFGTAEFDIIYLYSVFSHMTLLDVQQYLAEFHRILNPAGHVFLTAFVEEHVPHVSVNPPDYRRNWEGPLHCVRFDKSFFETLLAAPGFRVERFEYGQETDGQSAYYIAYA